jgi:hypothetical protein
MWRSQPRVCFKKVATRSTGPPLKKGSGDVIHAVQDQNFHVSAYLLIGPLQLIHPD